MERIDIHNYEAWFLDYSENNLSDSQINELNKFLVLHPNLKAELIEFEAIVLDNDTIENTALKTGLIREESTGLLRSEYLMIAEVEGNITKKEKAELSELVALDNSLMRDLALFQKTRLPKESVATFTGKSALLQNERKGFAWWTYASSAAAAAVVAFVMWNLGSVDDLYNPRAFAWQENNAQFEDNRLSGIVATESIEVGEEIEKAFTTAPTNQFAQEKRSNTLGTIKKQIAQETPVDVKLIENRNLAEQSKNLDLKKEKGIGRPEELPTIVESGLDDALAEVKTTKAEQDFIPIQKFAKDKIKKEILKGKTFTETVIDEIVDISNEKITFETNEEKEGLFQSFALNIGKLSISRNK